jgi:hypothetical protein
VYTSFTTRARGIIEVTRPVVRAILFRLERHVDLVESIHDIPDCRMSLIGASSSR